MLGVVKCGGVPITDISTFNNPLFSCANSVWILACALASFLLLGLDCMGLLELKILVILCESDILGSSERSGLALVLGSVPGMEVSSSLEYSSSSESVSA